MNLHPIAPMPAGGSSVLYQRISHEPITKKRRVARGACKAYCQRKVRCDGERPSCHPCVQLHSECIYPVKPGETRYQNLQRVNGELQIQLNDYQLLFGKLKSSSGDGKANILVQFDSSSDFDHVVDRIKPSESGSSTQISLQRDLKDHSDIMVFLRSVPEEGAIDTIRRLKAPSSTAMVLASLKDNISTIYRPSELQTARAILSLTDSRVEFELTSLHRVVYPILSPLDVVFIGIDALLRDAPQRSHSFSDSAPQSWDDRLIDREAMSFLFRDVMYTRPALCSGPLRTPQYSDHRLKHPSLKYWTTITVEDSFAASAISLYLENDHPIFGFFRC
ncbi:hypothetical protein B0J11DRAFT_617349 [Dendryphion nanum]|uniref:Zn(2)-C6 fungal-type domain-containing protein n=1 Tax=Dendryphion nanum TaxID=256645 RepID=A0A9P9DH31_9PLEO|nr:hypothetical protein B0J11DRAFT_617349 [Dendryphion nanum]